MPIFPSRTQKHLRNQKIIFAATTGLCLGVIGIGSVQAATAENSGKKSSSEEPVRANSNENKRSSASENSNSTSESSRGDPSSNTKAQTNIIINGEKMQLNEDGELHRSWQDGNSRGEVDINIDSGGQSSSSSSSVQIETRTRSSSGG